MRNRRKAREHALIMLYQQEVTGYPVDQIAENFWKENKGTDNIKEFATMLVEGTFKEKKRIDTILKEYSKHWEIDRIGIIEKNIIRLSIYQLLNTEDIPPSVVINEAIDITKKFGSEDSYQFVNGILDNIKKDLARWKDKK